MMRIMRGRGVDTPPFAPPFLKAGRCLIGQTANVLQYLGERHGLVPRDVKGRVWTHQLQLTLCDLLVETHDSHHPVGVGLYYEDQKAEAKRRSAEFLRVRIPKFLDYFERILSRNGRGSYLAGRRVSHADLSLFQVVAGLQYAFPRAMKRQARLHRRVQALHDRVAARPRIAVYLASARRIPFNEDGIFRCYPELER
jgi:glutathione S-transferase